jgi:hypothetical protein
MSFAHILPRAFFVFCENTWPGSYLVKSQWGFAIVETFHIMALGMLLGTLAIVDVRLLGFGMRRQTPAQLYDDLAPWTRLGVVLMILTGVPLFMSEAQRLSSSGPFFYKMVFLTLALVTHFTLHRQVTLSGAKVNSGLGKLAGCLSLLCWLGVALAGRAIAFV